MKNSRFQITPAVLNAWQFAAHEWRYLAFIAATPFIGHVAVSLMLEFLRPDATLMETFLWSLPTTALSGWFMFAEARLLLLQERIDRLPQDPLTRETRDNMMRASIIIWMLFNISVMAITLYFEWMARTKMFGANPLASGLAMILVGFLFWGVRFSVMHILAAVGYPLRDYFFRVNGIGISLRLIGLGLLTALPVLFVLQSFVALAFPAEPGPVGYVVLVVVGTFLSFVMTAVLNAAAVFALKEMLGSKGGRI